MIILSMSDCKLKGQSKSMMYIQQLTRSFKFQLKLCVSKGGGYYAFVHV